MDIVVRECVVQIEVFKAAVNEFYDMVFQRFTLRSWKPQNIASNIVNTGIKKQCESSHVKLITLFGKPSKK